MTFWKGGWLGYKKPATATPSKMPSLSLKHRKRTLLRRKLKKAGKVLGILALLISIILGIYEVQKNYSAKSESKGAGKAVRLDAEGEGRMAESVRQAGLQSASIQLQIDKTSAFFEKYQSPLKDYAQDIVNLTNIYGADYKLFAAISMVESTGCKHYPAGSFNCWGWGFDGHDDNPDVQGIQDGIWFGSFREGIETVAKAIATSPRYSHYREEKTLTAFAKIYNPNNWQDYELKLRYFYNEL